jgi:uncharacterized protein (TIGR02217 family)
MSFHDILFHPAISYGAVGGPGYNTKVYVADTTYETRNIASEYDAGAWDVAHSLKTQTELDYLIAFFRCRKGKGYSFRFLDWLDHEVVNSNLGVWNGDASVTFQIKKIYTDGAGYTDTRLITKPVNVANVNHTLSLSDPTYTTMQVKKTATVLTEGVDYSVDYSTGIITMLLAATSGTIYCSCSFHCHARFDTNQMKNTIEAYNIATWGQIPIIELKQVA